MSLIKLAGLWDGLAKGALGIGKALMKNNTLRSAAIGTGLGAAGGAVAAKPGERLSGAFKGGLVGAAAGGMATTGFNMYKNMKPAMGPGMNFMGALKQEGNVLKNTFSKARFAGQNGMAIGKGTALPWPTPNSETK